MPTVGHNPLEFALLVPGVRASGSDGQIPVSAFSGGKAAIAGGPVSANNYMVDEMLETSLIHPAICRTLLASISDRRNSS